MALVFQNRNHLIHIFLALFMRWSLYHDTNQRLCAALAHQDATIVAEEVRHLADLCLYVRIILRFRLAVHAHILQYLRIYVNIFAELAQGLLRLQQDFHHLQ